MTTDEQPIQGERTTEAGDQRFDRATRLAELRPSERARSTRERVIESLIRRPDGERPRAA